MNLVVDWSKPKKIKEGKSYAYIREWLIPLSYRGDFFEYWKNNKFKLLLKGYTVHKKKDDWFLRETQEKKSDFDKKVTPTKKTPKLKKYKLKNPSGLRPWQIDSVEKLVASIKQWGCAVDGSDVGCHAKGQQILMYDGSLKLVEDIAIGDIVCGLSAPQKVTELRCGNEQMAKIVPIKGDPFVVNVNHILTLKTTNFTRKHCCGFLPKTIYDIKVSDYLKLPITAKRTLKLFRSEMISHWDATYQPFDPYFIGMLLGDGGLSSSAITFTSTDKLCWDILKENIKKHNWELGKTSEDITKRITNAQNLRTYLKNIGLHPIKCENRFIPTEYKICDVKQRLEVLAGLLDTDGHYAKGGFDFTVKSEQLANDVAFICRSLGLAAYIKPTLKTCTNNGKTGLYYRVSISGDCSIIPTRLDRKKSSPRKQKKSALITGFSVELLNNDAFYGFSLDGDGRFLLGDFTVTHNTGKTYSACATARELDMNIMVVCPKAVKESWRRVIYDHFKLKDKCIGIVNYEQLRMGKKDSLYASYVRNRKTHKKVFTWKIPKKTLIIWDEAQKLKNHKTKNSETCITALDAGYKMLFCSATIATNPLELRTVGKCLQLFKNDRQYYNWAYDHGVIKGHFGLEFTNDKDSLIKINKDIFGNRGVRLNRDTIPNFPDSQIIAECYEMEKEDSAKIDQIYQDMQIELLKLEKLTKKEKNKHRLTTILRARQSIELLKVPLFVDMVNDGLENNMSVVVFCNFTDTISALSERLNTTCIINGAVKDNDRQKSIDDFQSDKERVILVNINAGGAGLSLHDLNGKYPRLALISPSYSAVLMRQATGRVWRDSAKTKSIQKIVFVANTIEETVCDTVNNKLDNLDLLNDGDLEYEKK